jgi:hypothetical protein
MLRPMAKTSVRTWPESPTRARLWLASPPKNSRAVSPEAMLRAIQSLFSAFLEDSAEFAPRGEGELLCVIVASKVGCWLR